MEELLVSFLREPYSLDEKILEGHAQARINFLVKTVTARCNSYALVEVKKFFKDIDKEWLAVVKRKPLIGRRCKRIMLQIIQGYQIDDYIKENYDFSLIHIKGRYKRMNYTYYKFLDLAKMEVAMLLSKYGDDLMKFEIGMAVVEMLIDFFEIYVKEFNYEGDNWVWCIKPDDINNCINSLLQMRIKDFEPYFKKYTNNVHLQKHTRFVEEDFQKPKKPQSKEDLESVYVEGMTATEFTEAIMTRWGVGDRTARGLKQKFGFSRSYGTHDDGEANLLEQQNELIAELTEKVTALEQQNAELIKKNDDLKKKISEITPSQMLMDKNVWLEKSNAYLKEQMDLLKVQLDVLKNKV